MTLLHQAAQKAVEALRQVTTSETFFRDPRGDRAGPAIDALEAALQHQEEPSTAVIPPAPPECETEEEKTAFSFGYWQGLHAARKGQEVPREPVADNHRKAFEDAVFNRRFRASVKRNPNPPRGFGGLDFVSVDCPTQAELCRRDAADDYEDETVSAMWWGWRTALAASPSTTQQPSVAAHALNTTPVVDHATQQEVGSGWIAELLPTATEAYEAAANVTGSALLAGETRSAEQRQLVYENACIALRGLFCVVDELKNRAAAPSTPEKAGGVTAGGEELRPKFRGKCPDDSHCSFSCLKDEPCLRSNAAAREVAKRIAGVKACGGSQCEK